MLIQNPNFKKLSFITIVLLILGLSVLLSMPARAGSKKFIGPEGGEVAADNNSYLVVPAGALGDEAAVFDALNNALALLKTQNKYIKKKVASKSIKNLLKPRNKDMEKEVDEIKKKLLQGDAKGAFDCLEKARGGLDYLRTTVANLLDDISATVRDTLQAQNDEIEQELEFAKEQLGKKIKARSSKEVIAIDGGVILSELNSANSLLDDQYAYINQLPKKDDGSGEWIKKSKKTGILADNEMVEMKVSMALQSHNQNWDKGTLKNTRYALKALAELDSEIDKLASRKKLGSAAYDKIKAYSDNIRAALKEVKSLYYQVLLFEFGPHGTVFKISAELVVPWDEVIFSDAMFWYAEGSDAVIDLVGMSLVIDEENETVIFFIDHFSSYFFKRR